MKLLARFEVVDPMGNRKLLKAFDDQGAVVLRLMGIGENPEALSTLAARTAAPAFWADEPSNTVEELHTWLCDSTPYTLGCYSTHPSLDGEKS